jgi:hypothetical protein
LFEHGGTASAAYQHVALAYSFIYVITVTR